MIWARRAVMAALAVGVAFAANRVLDTSSEAQALKLDLAEIDDIRYGLLDVDQWVGHVLVVMDRQVESFGESDDQRETVQATLEAAIRDVITEVERTIQRRNEDRPFGSLRQLATDFAVDFDDLRANAGTYAEIAVEELERPENRDRLKSYLRERVTAFSDSTFIRTDRSGFDAVLERRGCPDRDACRAALSADLSERSGALTQWTAIALGLAFVALAIGWFSRGSLGALGLILLLFATFTLLVGGLVTPMIDIRAEILALELEVAGEPIVFENQVLFFQSKSILDVVDLLIRTGRFDLILVGIGIGLFSVVFPVGKLFATMLYRLRPAARRLAPVRFFALESGKWSMADVFVIAMFLAFLGFDGLTGNQLAALMADSPMVNVDTANGTQLGVGFYWFTGFCLLGLFVSGIVKAGVLNGTPSTVVPSVEPEAHEREDDE